MRAPTNQEPVRGYDFISFSEETAGARFSSFGSTSMFNGEVKEEKNRRCKEVFTSRIFL